jgi:hypothetical protein
VLKQKADHRLNGRIGQNGQNGQNGQFGGLYPAATEHGSPTLALTRIVPQKFNHALLGLKQMAVIVLMVE